MNLCQRFETMAERFSDRIAIHSSGSATTYAHLNHLANTTAHTILDQLGEKPEQTVGLLTDQGLPLLTAIFGSLKAGRAFVPLDPSYPEARIRQMIEDARVQVMITQDQHLDFAEAMTHSATDATTSARVINLDQLDQQRTCLNPHLPISPDQLAYILYTSGSTGRPKGVMQEHKAVLHNMLRHRAIYQITEHDRQSLLYPTSVYGGTRDIFNALLNGAALYHYPVKDAGVMGLADYLNQHKVTIYCSVATVFRHFARELKGENLFPDLRFVKLGGEAPYRTDVELFRKHFNKACALLCGLGSTETGITRKYLISPDTKLDGAGIPLGYPVEDMGILLLDEQGRSVAPGQIGEIVIRSPYVFRGYFGRDDLNQQVLQTDPDAPGMRLFRTGDLGQFIDSDCLVHRGRKDHQVKIRGNRVELTEVETTIQACAGIKDAVVIAKPNRQGDMSLIGYVVHANDADVSVREIRQQLQQTLPHHAVPNTFVTIDAVPQTPNGKTDRLALPDPAPGSFDAPESFDTPGSSDTPGSFDIDKDPISNQAQVPANELEQNITKAWQKILGIPHVSADDSFFDLGGDSLMAVQLVLEVERAVGKSLPVSVFYHTPTIRKMAQWISGELTETVGKGVIKLNSQGTKPPLFCLPGRGGTAFSYRSLAALLNDDRPVFGLQYPGLEPDEDPIDNVEELAGELTQRIRRAYPDGPVLLLGYSFGGLLAYEIAQQLQSQGTQIPYLGMLDTMTPNAMHPRPLLQRLYLHAKSMTPAKALGLIKNRLHLGSHESTDSTWPGSLQQQADAQGQIAQAIQRLTDANQTARDHYQLRPYPGDLHLFQTTTQPHWYKYITLEPNYGWNTYVKGTIHPHTIPGAHLEIFDAAHAVLLADQVRASLNQC